MNERRLKEVTIVGGMFDNKLIHSFRPHIMENKGEGRLNKMQQDPLEKFMEHLRNITIWKLNKYNSDNEKNVAKKTRSKSSAGQQNKIEKLRKEIFSNRKKNLKDKK